MGAAGGEPRVAAARSGLPSRRTGPARGGTERSMRRKRRGRDVATPPSLLEVIQATLAPMFLITGAGIYLGFIQARLFRAVDRIRSLDEEMEEASEGGKGYDEAAPPPAEVDMAEVKFHVRRTHLLREAIALGSMTMVFTALTAVFIIVDAFLQADLALPVFASFGVALFCLAASLVYGLRDTYLSIRSVEAGLWARAQAELTEEERAGGRWMPDPWGPGGRGDRGGRRGGGPGEKD